MKVVFVISSFGLGHLTRQIALKDALLKEEPNLDIVFVISERQDNLMRDSIITSSNITIEHIPITPQVTMDDWTTVDKASTRESFLRFWEWETQIRDDAEWGRLLYGADLVINDIESVHNPIADKMGLPIVNISNFTWSDILEHLDLTDIAKNFRSWESLSTLDLKLPFSTKCSSYQNPKDIGLLVREVDWETVELYRKETRSKTVLLNYSHDDLPFELSKFANELLKEGYDVIIPERYTTKNTSEKIRIIPDHKTDYQNYYASADIIVSKIGYGTLSEALAGGTILLYWLREGFIEDQALHKGAQFYQIGEPISQHITPSELVKIIRKYENQDIDPIKSDNENIAKMILKYSEGF